jgi:hypothetical protein
MVKQPGLSQSQLNAINGATVTAGSAALNRGLVSFARALAKVMLFVAAVNLPAAVATSQQQPAAIIVIGTTHQETADFSSARLQQMLAEIKPDVILYEVDSSFFDAQGLLLAPYRQGQEGRAVWQHHLSTGTPIEPYEMEGRNQYYKKTNYFAREAAFSKQLSAVSEQGQLSPKATAQLAAVLAAFELRDTCGNSTPELINSPVCDAIVRKKHHYMYQVLLNVATETPALAGHTAFLQQAGDFWRTRNDAMAANIIARAKQRPGQRIVVITGFEHRPELLERLQAQAVEVGYNLGEFTLQDK